MLTPYNRSNCSRVTSRNGLFSVMPALFTRQSTPPRNSTACRASSATASRSSKFAGNHRGPAPQRADLFGGGLRSRPAVGVVQHHVGALAGKLQGDLRPIPVPEPVTKARLPASFALAFIASFPEK